MIGVRELHGRERELAELLEQVRARERLVSIVGPGGVGKTRLLVELGAKEQRGREQVSLELVGGERTRRHRRSVLSHEVPAPFCDLGPARSADDVVFRLARALDVELSPTSEVETARVLAEAIEDRAPLLLIDNVEQVADEVRALLAEILPRAPTATFVLTSRVPVGLSEETVFRLHPLTRPDAVALLLEVVRQSAPDADWQRADAALLDDLVEQVDRLPLALRLVGARARSLSPEQVLENLRRQLDFLRARPAGHEGRHASMRAALEWSWDLLDPEARRAATLLSVFAGSFDLEAASTVVARGVTSDTLPTLEVLEDLLDHSLLWSSHPAHGAVRLSFYVCARELASEHLARSDEEHAARERHAAYFARRAEAALATGHGDRGAWAALEPNLEDIAAAAAFVRERRPERAARLLYAQSRVLASRAPLAVQRELLQAATAAARQAREPTTGLAAVHSLARFLANAGFLGEALGELEKGLDLARAAKDERGEARLLSGYGYAAICLDRAQAARDALERARAIIERTGDIELGAQWALYAAILDEEPIDSAVAAFDQVAAIGETTANPRLVWYGLVNALEQRHLQGTEPPRSRTLAALAELGETVADRQMRLWLGLGQTRHALVHGELQAAEEQARRVLADARAFGSATSQCVARALAAEIALDQNDGAARGHVLAARELARKVEHRWVQAHVSWIEARLREAEGDLDGAVAAYHSVQAVQVGDHLACFRADARISLALLQALGDGAQAAVPALVAAVEQAEQAGALGAVALGAVHVEAIAARLGRDDLAAWGRTRTDRALQRVVARSVLALVAELRGGPSSESHAARRARRVLAAIGGRDTAHLTVAADASWLEVAGQRTSLSRRGPMRRILHALVEQHARSPGVALPHAQVCGAGWPGERMHPDSARTRVYNAIRLLRRLGIESDIVTTDAGYLLDPRVQVDVAAS